MAGPQGPGFTRRGGARVHGGGGGDRAYEVGQTGEDPLLAPPTAVFEGSLFTCSSSRESGGRGIHSSTYQLNLSRLLSLTPPTDTRHSVSHKTC